MDTKLVIIGLDAMGGDRAPDVNIAGAVSALSATSGLKLVLTGQRPSIEQALKRIGASESENLSIVHCEEVVSMDDHAASAFRKKKDSSIHVGLESLRDGKIDAFISAGNSGAVMAGALLILGRLNEVERPAIVVKLPTAESYVILLDVGANVDCKPSHLLQFAQMGKVFAESVEGVPNPRIALLSNGTEAHKGNELTREANALLKEANGMNYVGYIEGYDIFRSSADVIVCDGFVGNLLLKLSEGLADTTAQWFRRELKGNLVGIAGALLLKPLLKKFRAKFDYQPYGAAPLLGVNGLVLISHGSSTELAIRNGILTAKKAVEQGLMSQIKANLGAKT